MPLFSARDDFKKIMGKMGLQARGTAGVDSASTGGTWDISNADRLGKSEVQLCNIFIEGIAQVIRWEQALEEGKYIADEVKAVMVENIEKVLERGETMYATYCTPCHGDGHKELGPVGDPARFANVVQIAGPTGTISNKSDGYLYLTIRNGGALMPYYGWGMDDEEMWSIVHYLRTLPNGRYKPKANKETP